MDAGAIDVIYGSLAGLSGPIASSGTRSRRVFPAPPKKRGRVRLDSRRKAHGSDRLGVREGPQDRWAQ